MWRGFDCVGVRFLFFFLRMRKLTSSARVVCYSKRRIRRIGLVSLLDTNVDK